MGSSAVAFPGRALGPRQLVSGRSSAVLPHRGSHPREGAAGRRRAKPGDGRGGGSGAGGGAERPGGGRGGPRWRRRPLGRGGSLAGPPSGRSAPLPDCGGHAAALPFRRPCRRVLASSPLLPPRAQPASSLRLAAVVRWRATPEEGRGGAKAVCPAAMPPVAGGARTYSPSPALPLRPRLFPSVPGSSPPRLFRSPPAPTLPPARPRLFPSAPGSPPPGARTGQGCLGNYLYFFVPSAL
jgi:hypothetical protein